MYKSGVGGTYLCICNDCSYCWVLDITSKDLENVLLNLLTVRKRGFRTSKKKKKWWAQSCVDIVRDATNKWLWGNPGVVLMALSVHIF